MNVIHVDFVAEARRRRLPAPVRSVLDWLVLWFQRIVAFGVRLYQVLVAA